MRSYLALSFLAIATLPIAAMDSDFGTIGITSFETARMIAFCDGSVVPAPCDITFTFHDLNGKVLKQTTMTLAPETTGFLDFSLTGLAVFSGRVEINPGWTVLRGTAQASLELIENFTQRTRLLIAWSGGAMPRPGGDVDFGAADITAFDTARMSAACQASGPACNVVFTFHNATGEVLQTSRAVVQPGAAAFADFRIPSTSASGGRITIDPCWTVANGSAVLSFQTFDTFSGLTLTQAFPSLFASASLP